MSILNRDDNGRLRLGPVALPTVLSSNGATVLDSFEPENPSLFVPRRLGAGWDLNLGAVAVKAGWIRPDDSLPDLAQHIPHAWRRGLRIAPVAGALAIGAMAASVARHESVPVKWSFAGRPRKFASGKTAALTALGVTAGVALLPRVMRSAGAASGAGVGNGGAANGGADVDPETRDAIRVGEQAQLLGAEAVTLAVLLATKKAASSTSMVSTVANRLQGKDPRDENRQILAGVAPLLWPVVAGGVQIACVKSALNGIAASLRNNPA